MSAKFEYNIFNVNALPNYLEKYFWDIDFEKIDFDKRRPYVLQRLLEYGDEKALAWVWKNFKREEMKHVLSHYRGYSRKSANYWSIILDVPLEEIACLKKRSSETPKVFWPY